MYTGRYTWGEGGRAGLTIWSRARILIPLNRTDKPTDDESGRKTWEMKNGTYVFRGGSTDILTTNERGIYPSGGHQRFVTKGRNIDAACRSIFLSLSLSLLFPFRFPDRTFLPLSSHLAYATNQPNRISRFRVSWKNNVVSFDKSETRRSGKVEIREEEEGIFSFSFSARSDTTYRDCVVLPMEGYYTKEERKNDHQYRRMLLENH